jgi:hypothetical protein
MPPFTDPLLWKPLFVIIFPTRPLAATLSRLSKAHERGLPFYATVPDKDRIDGESYWRRLIRMKIDRTKEVVNAISEKLRGKGGGFTGIRFSSTDRGRAAFGERLKTGIEKDKRKIKVLWQLETPRNYREGWEEIEDLEQGWCNEWGEEVECDEEAAVRDYPPETRAVKTIRVNMPVRRASYDSPDLEESIKTVEDDEEGERAAEEWRIEQRLVYRRMAP